VREDAAADLEAAQAALSVEQRKAESLRKELASSHSSAEQKATAARERLEGEVSKWRAAAASADDACVALRSETTSQLMAMKEGHSQALQLLEQNHRAALDAARAEAVAQVAAAQVVIA